MPGDDELQTVLRGPITTTEPDFVRDLPVDNLVGAIVGLAAEVYLLRERLQAMEAELEARRVIPPGAVEHQQPTPEQAAARQADLAAFVNRVLGELSRDRKPASQVDPAVTRYLDPRS
jgi:hypothetical protein